jgi:hypothetical protein
MGRLACQVQLDTLGTGTLRAFLSPMGCSAWPFLVGRVIICSIASVDRTLVAASLRGPLAHRICAGHPAPARATHSRTESARATHSRTESARATHSRTESARATHSRTEPARATRTGTRNPRGRLGPAQVETGPRSRESPPTPRTPEPPQRPAPRAGHSHLAEA